MDKICRLVAKLFDSTFAMGILKQKLSQEGEKGWKIEI